MSQTIDLTGEGLPVVLPAVAAPAQPARQAKRKRKVDPQTAAGADAEDEVTAPRKAKKTRTKKAETEKRVAFTGKVVRYCKAPPQATRERIQRALPGETCPWQVGEPAESSSGKSSLGPLLNSRKRRVYAGSGHRMFLLSRKTVAPPGSDTGAQEDFEILGATGNGEVSSWVSASFMLHRHSLGVSMQVPDCPAPP